MVAPNENEDRLVEAFRALPPVAAKSLLTWATEPSEVAKDENVEWSDSWTDEDVADLRRASMANFEARESDNDGCVER